MRHLQRMQLGMALAAVLLCLTSTAMTVHATHEPAGVSSESRRLSSVLHLDENSEGTIEIFRNVEQDKLPILVLRPTDMLYSRFVASMNGAVLSADTKTVNPSCFIVVYSKTGQARALLHANADGLLYDDQTKSTFRAGRVFVDFIGMILKTRTQ